MQFTIHAGNDMPIYRQIANQVVDAIGDGRLVDGDRLASHRELGEQLVIAPLTVKKAYEELEAEGLICSVRGRGTFVTARASSAPARVWQERLRAPAKRLLEQAEIAGVPFTKLVELLRAERSALAARSKATRGKTERRGS